MDLADLDCGFNIEADKTNFKYKIADGCSFGLDLNYNFSARLPAINLELPDIKFQLGTLPDVPFAFQLGNFDIQLGGNIPTFIRLPDFNVQIPNLAKLGSFSLNDLKGLKINGIEFNPEIPGLNLTGFNISTGLGTIQFDELAGFPLRLHFEMDKLTLDFDTEVNLDFTLKGWNFHVDPEINLDLSFNYDGTFNLARFEIPDFAGFSIDPSSLQILKGKLVVLDIEAGTMKFNYDGINVGLGIDNFNINTPQSFSLDWKPTALNLKMADLLAGYDFSKGLHLGFEGLNMSLLPELGTLSFNGVDVSLFEKYGALSIGLDGKLASLSPKLLKMDLGDYAFNLDPKGVRLELIKDFMDIGFDGKIGASFGDYSMGTLPAVGFDFKAPDFSTGLNTTGFYSVFSDISLGLSLDQKLTISGFGTHKLDLSPTGFSYGFDNVQIGYDLAKSLRFKGFDFDADIEAMKGITLNYQDLGLSVDLASNLKLNLGIDKSLTIDPKLLTFKYDDIGLGFGIDKNLWFTALPYKFELTPQDLSLSYDDLKLGLGLNQSLSFMKGPNVSLNLTPELLDFKIPDYSLSFNSKILSLKSPVISFSTDNLIFNIGNYNVGLTLVNEIPAIRLWDPKTLDISLDMNRQGLLKYSGLDLKVSPTLLFDFKYDNALKLLGNYSFIKLGVRDFNIRVGLDTLINLNLDPCRVMFLLQDPSGKIPNFRPGLYSICDEFLVSANLGGLRFSQGINSTKRSFNINQTMTEFTYDEFEKDRFTGSLNVWERV